MSADNGIYVLRTQTKKDAAGFTDNVAPVKFIWRVAYASAIDNLNWYSQPENLHSLDAYVQDVWGKSKVYYDKAEAMAEARKQADAFTSVLEYGIQNLFLDLILYQDQ